MNIYKLIYKVENFKDYSRFVIEKAEIISFNSDISSFKYAFTIENVKNEIMKELAYYGYYTAMADYSNEAYTIYTYLIDIDRSELKLDFLLPDDAINLIRHIKMIKLSI